MDTLSRSSAMDAAIAATIEDITKAAESRTTSPTPTEMKSDSGATKKKQETSARKAALEATSTALKMATKSPITEEITSDTGATKKKWRPSAREAALKATSTALKMATKGSILEGHGEEGEEESLGEDETATPPSTAPSRGRRLWRRGETTSEEEGEDEDEDVDEGEREDEEKGEEDEERHSPTITVLFSRPEIWSPFTDEMGVSEEEQLRLAYRVPCSVLEGAPRICKFLGVPPLTRSLPGPLYVSPAEATMNALERVDFSRTIAALSSGDSDLTSSDRKDSDEIDLEGIERWRRAQLDWFGVSAEEYGEQDLVPEESHFSCSEVSEIPPWKHRPLVWFPDLAQFELYWELLDPRATVRDLDEDEEGPIKNRRDRAIDLLKAINKYFKNVPKDKECSDLEDSRSLYGEGVDPLEGLNLSFLPYASVDAQLREKIYQKYTFEISKKIEALKRHNCEEPMTKETKENLRNMQYRAGRWIVKQLDNEFSFLPKKPKDKILIPRDPTLSHDMKTILSEIASKVSVSEIDSSFIQDILRSKLGSLQLHPDDLLEKGLDDMDIRDMIMKGFNKYITGQEPDFSKLVMECLDRDDMEKGIRKILEDVRDSADFSKLVMECIDREDVEKAIRKILEEVRETAIGGETRAMVKTIIDDMINEAVKVALVSSGLVDSIIDKVVGKEEEEEEEEEHVSEEVSEEERSSFSGDDTKTIIAKFHLENKRCFYRLYLDSINLENIKDDMASLCEVPENFIILELGEEVLVSKQIVMPDYSRTLKMICKELGSNTDEVNFTLKSYDDLRYPLRTEEMTAEPPIISLRIVHVNMDKYETRTINVTIVDDCIVKPFIGGFRNKKTGIELHNAFTQTGPFIRKIDRTHRDTQTYHLKHLTAETVQHKQTQMWRRDCYITPEYDYIIVSKPYMEADRLFALMRYEEMAIVIQRFWRKYKLMQLLKELANKARECKRFEMQQEKARLKDISERHKLVLVQKTYPRTKADFDMWYAMVEKWRLEETEKAAEMRETPGRKADLLALHLAEVDLLRGMEAHRTCLREEKRERRDLALIDACARPVEWTGKDGCPVAMDTTRTQRARELRRLYHALARPDVTLEERMEVLMQLKFALVPYNKVLPTQLIRLIERESELLLKGLRRSDQIDILHKRVLQLYLELLKDPDFNPEAAKHTLEYNVAGQKRTFHVCARCERLKKKISMDMDATTLSLRVCDACAWVQHIGSRRYDMGPYRDLMRAIQRDEAKRQAYSSVAFVMRDVDFYWLILNLWHSESFLTEEEDISAMRMPRWDVRQEWSPWNCILLTDDETKWHLRLPSLEAGYSAELMGEVHNRHVTARLHFRQLVKTDKYFRESCQWFQVSRRKDYVAPSEQADAFLGKVKYCGR